jgi:hypothetical protein
LNLDCAGFEIVEKRCLEKSQKIKNSPKLFQDDENSISIPVKK